MTQRWHRLSLATRFAIVSGAVFLIATTLIGAFIVTIIETSVARNSANATAHFMDSVLAPVSGQLSETGTLSPGARRALDEIFENTALGERVASYKIWGVGGTVIAASDKSIEGQTFAMTDNLIAAWSGDVMADFGDLRDAEDAGEAGLGVPLLEIYIPLREAWSGKTIAIAEFYEINRALRDDLDAARARTWGAVAAISLSLGAILYIIVLGGSRTIESQRIALGAQLTEVRNLSARNTDLRIRVQKAAGRAAAAQENTMRRIGADLHDGPAQDLAFAALRLDSLVGRSTDADAQAEIASIKGAIDSALTEVRSLSRGLSLPQIADLSLSDIVLRVTEAHRLRSAETIVADLACDGSFPLTEALRICVFRFVQETLKNASHHAPGATTRVSLACDQRHFRLTVEDTGPGFPDTVATPPDRPARGLGLVGLRDRVESLGGTFRVETRAAGGAVLEMTLDTGN